MTSTHMHKLKYMKRHTRKSGAVAYYVQITRVGRCVRLHADPLTNYGEFIIEYNKAIQELLDEGHVIDKRKKINTHTVKSLIKAFKDQGALDDLKFNTVRNYQYAFDRIERRFGTYKFYQVTEQEIILYMDKLPRYTANMVLNAFKRLTRWARKRKLVDTDPAREIVGNPKSKIGFPSWDEQDIKKYHAAHPIGSHARLCIDLLQFTGMRIGDLIELGPKNIKLMPAPELGLDEAPFIVKTCNKTGMEITIPFHRDLQASIAASETGSETFLRMRRFDRPYKDSGAFGEVFRKFCRQAGLRNDKAERALSGHGLRRTVTERAINNGVPETDVAALMGWTTTAMVSFYAKQINRNMIGRNRGYRMFITNPFDAETA